MKRHDCAACGRLSPPVQTAYTLIGGEHGWRTVVASDANGRRGVRWYCADCWKKHKEESGSQRAERLSDAP